MILIAELLYDLITKAYFSAIRIAALFNPKASKWVEGRRRLFNELEEAFAFQKSAPQKVVWFHCASLGEFEQGRTVIERLKEQHPSTKILITFFSPSGYVHRKNTPLADWVFYLPADTSKNAKRFLAIVQPTFVVFVKYEFWYHYLIQLKKQKIPTFLIAAVFRRGQLFFSRLGILYREMLACFNTIFVQNEKSKVLLETINYSNCKIAGDPRIDRVLDISGQDRKFPAISSFCGDNPILVCGSTWKEDELILKPFIEDSRFKHWKLIIAPHDVSQKRIQEAKAIFNNKVLVYSEVAQGIHASPEPVLLIDEIGQLAWLYKYGQVAYIGGGFGKSIHNTLEPMAFNLPVLYGPKYTKFVEALEMKKEGGHFPVRSSEEFLNRMSQLENQTNFQRAKNAISDFMGRNKGASKAIVNLLSPYL